MLFKLDRVKAELSVWRQRVLKLVNWRTAPVIGIIFCLLYAGIFMVPRNVDFSYAAATCTGELTLFPGMHHATDTTKFKLEYRGGVSVGDLKLSATKICFVPTTAPKKAVVQMADAPFGGWVFRAHYKLTVGDAPRLLGGAPKPQPLSKPLSLTLSQSDRVFKYYLEVESKTQLCGVSAQKLLCGVDKLGLKQGTVYALKLQRSFGGKAAGAAIPVQLAILPSTRVAAQSIHPDEMVYAKPMGADVTFDKPLVAATGTLEVMDGDKATPVAITVKVDGARVAVTWAADLPREKTFRLTLTSATASDGSTLDGAYAFNFQTSGGPKVVSVSIGAAGVAVDTRAIVTFDQALAKDTNIASFANIAGGSATISRQGSNQVVFALHGIPLCGAFTLNIAKGLLSDAGIPSAAAWSQASRITCRTTRTIGYSVKGRPILAYFYGTGATTVLFTGGIHGSEPSGTYLMQDWASYLDTNGYKIPANKQVVIVPNLNPDGIAANQRYNANNVNLDRNFPTSDWIADIPTGGGQTLMGGGGSTPLSEPETRAIISLSSSLQIRAEISFHSSGALVGANKIADSVAIGTQYAAAVGYQTVFYDPEATFGYSLTGEYETWLGEKFGTPAILIELPTSTGRYFSRHQNELWNMVNL